ncbi:MAG TPA: hypothetical protein VL400_20135 [Polyangiaceae bacterium]|jgi:hypothetical protein|nr:hypothetical protein [Polyangiaceae bacterium]
MLWRRALVPAVAVFLLSLGAGCDKLKSLSGSATATAQAEDDESAGADESQESSDDAPKKKPKKKKKKAVADAAQTGSPALPAPLTPSAQAPAQPAIDYFADATPIPAKLKATLGSSLRVYELTIYPTYSFAKIQDPKVPLHVDQYEVRDGKVGEPTPVKFVGKEPTAAELHDVTFDLDEPDWTQVPRMLDDAPKRIKVEGGAVTHVIVNRFLPFEKEVRFRVYVNGPRSGGGYVMYDVHGVMRKVQQ